MFKVFYILDSASYTPGESCSICPPDQSNCYKNLCTSLPDEEAAKWNGTKNLGISIFGIVICMLCVMIFT